jgi:hypothetical protein
MSWVAGGLDHTENGNAGIGLEITKGDGFGTFSVEGFRPYGYSPMLQEIPLQVLYQVHFCMETRKHVVRS